MVIGFIFVYVTCRCDNSVWLWNRTTQELLYPRYKAFAVAFDSGGYRKCGLRHKMPVIKYYHFHVNVQKLSSDNKNPNSQNQNYPLNKETKINKADWNLDDCDRFFLLDKHNYFMLFRKCQKLTFRRCSRFCSMRCQNHKIFQCLN